MAKKVQRKKLISLDAMVKPPVEFEVRGKTITMRQEYEHGAMQIAEVMDFYTEEGLFSPDGDLQDKLNLDQIMRIQVKGAIIGGMNKAKGGLYKFLDSLEEWEITHMYNEFLDVGLNLDLLVNPNSRQTAIEVLEKIGAKSRAVKAAKAQETPTSAKSSPDSSDSTQAETP